MSKRISIVLFLLCALLFLWGCTTTKLIQKETEAIDKETSQVTPLLPRGLPEITQPTADEKPSPFAGKTITLSADHASFTNIFSAIAEIAGLDLVIDSRLVPEGRSTGVHAQQAAAPAGQAASVAISNNSPIFLRPVSVAFNRTPLEQALDTLADSLNIFYEIRGRCLYVKGTGSRTYHLNFISSNKETRISVGGDVLGGSSSNGSGSTGSSSSSSSSSNNSSPLSGQFSIENTTTTSSNDIYTQIEQVVKSAMTEHGSFSMNRAIGFLEVTDRRSAVNRIDGYVKTIKTYYNSQVVITAKILEVSLNDASRHGIDWTSMNGSIRGYVFNPIKQTLQLPATNPVPAFSMNVANAESGFEAAINALQEFGNIKVLSNPRVRVTNGQPAMISVGTNTSYIQEVKLTTTSVEGGTSITQPDVTIGSIFDGIMMGVLPYIDLEKNEVNLSITPIKSRIISLDEKLIGGNTYTLPTVDLKEVTTQLRVKSGNVVALGGLISKGVADESTSIPILGTIPYLGYLFSQKSMRVETSELVILLEPVIIEQ
jgi:MSHA biogenesis protein MshL